MEKHCVDTACGFEIRCGLGLRNLYINIYFSFSVY